MDERRTGSDASSHNASSYYVADDFQSLCAAARELEDLRRSRAWRGLLVAVVRRWRAVWRGVKTLQRLDQLELPLTHGPAGEAIRRSMRSRSTRIARPVLHLPAERDQYHRGRSRQALRTNVRHAEALGIVCHELFGAQRDAALDELLAKLDLGGAERTRLEAAVGLEPSRQGFHAAVDAAGKVIALAAVEVDLHCARLVFLRSVGGEHGGPARYALSLHVIHSLIDRHVRLLIVGGAVRLAPGLQYFQQRLGFEIFNVRPVPVAEQGVTQPSRQRSRIPGWSAVRLQWRALVLLLVFLASVGFFHSQDPATWEDLLDTLIPVEVSLTALGLCLGLAV